MYQGSLDEVEIYNRALTSSEIQAIFNAGSAGKCKVAANQPPTITSFTATPSSGIAPLSVTFTAVASDPDGTIASVQWDFNGDGTVDQTTTTLTTSFTYTIAGTFTPMVTVMDNAGATASASTTVTVQTPAQAINALISSIQGLPLNAGQKNSLIGKLNAASASIDKGKLTAACNQLNAFMNEVNALVQSKRLNAATANMLISEAQGIKAALGCP